MNGWSATELTLSALKKFTRYEVKVRAFNGVAAGPPSPAVTATTLEGGKLFVTFIFIFQRSKRNKHHVTPRYLNYMVERTSKFDISR